MPENKKYTKEEMLQIKGEMPVEGFKEFWQSQYASARAWKINYTIEGELWSPEKDCRIYKLRFTSIDGFSIGMRINFLSRNYRNSGKRYSFPATDKVR